MESKDVLSVIEAAYRLDRGTDAWLAGVGHAAYEQLGAGLGLYGFFYTVGPDGRLRLGEELNIDTPAHLAGPAHAALESLPPAFVQKTFARCECTTQSEAADAEMRPIIDGVMDMAAQAFGWRDILILGGMDPSGQGVYLGAWLPEKTRLSEREVETWSRVAVHVVTAARLRRRLDRKTVDAAEAVLTPEGKVELAQGEADSQAARDTLREAVCAVERARGELRHEDPHRAVDSWKGLVRNRWSLVDCFESDGRRYVVARQNEVKVNGAAALTARERQAVGYAALGHGNKLIGYEMGVSPSTVAVLLHRAARKLEARSRVDLLQKARDLWSPPVDD